MAYYLYYFKLGLALGACAVYPFKFIQLFFLLARGATLCVKLKLLFIC